ncbi:MAG: hypothetical protein LBS05_09245 [Tannerellaceae bacterium]|jgi:hypothetical protein|nr:hypothetical protein [Tannerellaceae bacterium]
METIKLPLLENPEFGIVALILIGIYILILLAPYIWKTIRLFVFGLILPLLVYSITLTPITLAIAFTTDSSLFVRIPLCIIGGIISMVVGYWAFNWYADLDIDDEN